MHWMLMKHINKKKGGNMDNMHNSIQRVLPNTKIEKYASLENEFSFNRTIRKFAFCTLIFFTFILCVQLYQEAQQKAIFRQIKASSKETRFKVFSESGNYTYQKPKEKILETP
jgi:hypothetical protein